MTEGVLLDTHTAIWLVEDDPISAPARSAIEAAWHTPAVHFAAVSAWEIAMLVAKGHLALAIPPTAWISRLLEGGVLMAPMSPWAMIDAATLPGSPMNDPADRMLVAVARELDLALVTRDREVLAYAKKGHVRAIAC